MFTATQNGSAMPVSKAEEMRIDTVWQYRQYMEPRMNEKRRMDYELKKQK